MRMEIEERENEEADVEVGGELSEADKEMIDEIVRDLKGERKKSVKVRLTRKEKAERIVEMYNAGYTYKEICEVLRVAPKTIARVLREAEIGDMRPEIEERLKRMEERVQKLESDVKELKQEMLKKDMRIEKLVRAVKQLYQKAVLI
ncbi:hypothetical protein DRO29_06235 [Candidatus Bathyarchaeota archaeon]|nr:MAG: hypothetical protein DRO29_06235 [Candidatus Bathyarchaeota archaeon]